MKSKKQIEPADPEALLLWDIPTAARMLSTNVWALRRLLKSGEIPYLNIGHKWLISPNAIRAYIRQRESDFRKDSTKAA